MKISANTLSLLQSFSGINSNLHIKPGNKLITRNASGNAQARAVVEETFPTQFAIYDLNQLLGLILVSADPDIEFGDKSMLIKSANGGEIEYFYADPSLVTAPPDSDLEIDPIFNFTMTTADINVVQKTASIVSATTLSVVCNNGSVFLKINDPKNTTSNSYKRSLGTSDKTFNVKMSIDNFRPIVPDTYDVQIGMAKGRGGSVLVFHFSSTNRKLTYLIAADPSSKV